MDGKMKAKQEEAKAEADSKRRLEQFRKARAVMAVEEKKEKEDAYERRKTEMEKKEPAPVRRGPAVE